VNDVTVIGAGVAGTAAALALAASGAAVTVIVGPAGASQLAPGVFDGVVGEAAARVLAVLGAFALEPCAVATLAGVVRAGAGRDRALLDVGALEAGEVLVPRSTRQGWDADALARMLSASPLAIARGLVFRAIDASLVRYADERVVSDAVIAARHDDPERLGWLADRLRLALGGSRPRGLLLPPWLGASEERASELGARLGTACGEIAIGLSGPAGFRFAAARDRALTRANVEMRRAFATRAVEGDASVIVELEGGDTLESRACVMATGGLVGGGLVYDPSEAAAAAEYPLEARPYARASVASMPVGVRDRLLVAPGSLFGVAPEAIAWPFVEESDLERVGVLVEDGGRVRGARRLFACGELVADRDRTWLAAASSGVEAASAASLTLSEGAGGRARSSG
jgi:glycerol-3-phosphate dehydrogenase subunit B